MSRMGPKRQKSRVDAEILDILIITSWLLNMVFLYIFKHYAHFFNFLNLELAFFV